MLVLNIFFQKFFKPFFSLHTSIIPYQRSVQLATTTFHHPQNYPNNLNCYSNFTQPVVDWNGGNTGGRTGGDLYLRVDATLEIGTANSIGGSAAYVIIFYLKLKIQKIVFLLKKPTKIIQRIEQQNLAF